MNDIYKKLVLNKQSAIPLYYQFKQFVIELINRNELKEGDVLPTESELCEMLEISRPTLRQAFAELVNEGYLTRQRAKGTFVSKRSISSKFVNKIVQFSEEMDALGVKSYRTEVKKCRVEEVGTEIAEALQLKNHQAIVLYRKRYVNDEPLVFEHTYIPARLFKGLEDINFERNSLYEHMKKDYGLYVARTEKSVRAIAAMPEIAKMLEIEIGAPILRVITQGYSPENIPIEYSIAYYICDRYTMKLDVVTAEFKGELK